jgi:Alkaline phosphatase PhoX
MGARVLERPQQRVPVRRVEDIAYDKRPGHGNTVYIVDSGRGRTALQSLDTPNFRSTNGRVWKMVLDPSDPTKVLSLSILVEGDDNPTALTNPTTSFNEIHQPDNLETTANGSLLVTEDPSGNNNYPPAEPPTTPARLWKLDLAAANVDASRLTVAKVDQSADEGSTDVDPSSTPGALGSWESSGVVDASSVYGPGAFFIDVQAHTLWIEASPGPDVTSPAGPDWTNKREGGQLLLIQVPGA